MELADLFEVIGPIMVGPSSSHTAGAIRLGLLARSAAGFSPVHALIELHGSFGETGRGHGTDRGLVAGLLGWATDDHRLGEVGIHARNAGLVAEFRRADLGSVHPNTARFHLSGPEGRRAVIQGSSIGGGAVLLTELDGWSVELAGNYHTLLIGHSDKPGLVARITGSLAMYGLNIATMRVARRARGGQALATVELDNSVAPGTIALLEGQPDILWVRTIAKI